MSLRPYRSRPARGPWAHLPGAAGGARWRARAHRYLAGGAGFGLGDVKTYLSTDATRASWRVFKKCVLATCRSHIRYHADGSLTNQSLKYLPEHAASLRKAIRKLVAAV